MGLPPMLAEPGELQARFGNGDRTRQRTSRAGTLPVAFHRPPRLPRWVASFGGVVGMSGPVWRGSTDTDAGVEAALIEATDGVLLAAAQADPRAFAHLYRRYVGLFARYCRRSLNSPEAAEDATAQVFARALAALPSCRGAFRPWLFAIAHNVLADRHRRPCPDRPLEAAAALPWDGPSPEEAVEAAEERRALEEAIVRLPADQRAAIELRLAGLTGAEVATALGRSPAATRMLQSCAVATLRTILVAESGHAVGGTDG
jgi:RNA polymerase sigma-70 factor (ECF subfamily)